MCTPSNTRFLGPTWVNIPNGISIGSALFNTWRQKVPTLHSGPPIAKWAAHCPCTLGVVWTLVQCMLPWVHPTQHPKRNLGTESPYFTMGRSFPLKIAHSHEGSGPQLIHGSLDPSKSTTQTASRWVQPCFSQGSGSWQTYRQWQTDRPCCNNSRT